MVEPQSTNFGADRKITRGIIEAAFFRSGGGNGGAGTNCGADAATQKRQWREQ